MLSEKIVEGLFRLKLGYRGVAIASDLDAGAGLLWPQLGEAAVQSINAGCDMLIVAHPEISMDTVLAALRRGVESGRIARERFTQALERIRHSQAGVARPTGKVSRTQLERLAREFEDFAKACGAGGHKLA